MKDINQLQIGKPAECYPFKDGFQFIYLPFKSTSLELYFDGNKNQYAKIVEYWKSIGSPEYDRNKSKLENMISLKKSFGKFPKPMFNEKVIQVLKLEYEYDR